MKFIVTLVLGLISLHTLAVSETVYVESPTDTDRDGKRDLIYVSIDRPSSDKKLSTLYYISPYALGGTDVPMHDVDMDILPQDAASFKSFFSRKKDYKRRMPLLTQVGAAPRYAKIKAHSLGTGYSTGCPTVGDEAEILGAKAVIDWLNGRARAFYKDGTEAVADWANGHVGMTGVSYDGTLPIMVATTGVEGLKAIVPIAAISNWYNYYRANGLVVNPGGYIGEDADILGYFIVRRGACQQEMANITRMMGRENGDFTPFWQERNHLANVKNIKAATFIIHGQSDWNVKQKHAIELWEGLHGVAPRRMFLHRGGHSSTSSFGVPRKIQDWFDHFLEGVDNGITTGPQVEVELPNGTLVTQEEWPHEETQTERFYFDRDALSVRVPAKSIETIFDNGKSQKIEKLLENPEVKNDNRLIFLSEALTAPRLLSGTPKVSLRLSLKNRSAANLTVVVIEYDKDGKGRIVTRGWADPQNYRDFTRGERLVPGQAYDLSFDLEPKEYQFSEGNKIGILVTMTDYDYTMRPTEGTIGQVVLGAQSFIELRLTK